MNLNNTGGADIMTVASGTTAIASHLLAWNEYLQVIASVVAIAAGILSIVHRIIQILKK
jgi:hypothetical protein